MLLQDKLPRAKVEMDAVRPEDRVAQKARGVSARYRIQFVHGEFVHFLSITQDRFLLTLNDTFLYDYRCYGGYRP